MLKRIVGSLGRLSALGLPSGSHLTRYYMYRELADTGIPRLVPPDTRALSISGSEALVSALGMRANDVDDASFPEHDLRDLRAIDDNSYGLVVSDQVLEHVEGDPQVAVAESLRVLRPGGVVVHTTCFMNPIHRHPVDFWRFSPECLRWLLRDADVIAAKGWGNRRAGLLMGTGLRFVPVPHASWHPLHRLATRNEPDWPIVTWVVARKPQHGPRE